MAKPEDRNEEISFESFQRVWKNKFGPNIPCQESTYNKLKSLNRIELMSAIDHMAQSANQRKSALGEDDILVVHVKPISYITKLKSDHPTMELHSLPLDKAKSLHLVVYIRNLQNEVVPGARGKFVTDRMAVEIGNEESKTVLDPTKFRSELVEGMKNIKSCPLTYEFLGEGEAIIVKGGPRPGSLPLANMALVSFVDDLFQRLGCEAKDELIVVPFMKDQLCATKSSSPIGCCMLGDLTCPDEGRAQPEWITSTPLRVQKIDRTVDEIELLSNGRLPVTWEFYHYWGQAPLSGTKLADGKVRFPIPGNEAQAELFKDALEAGTTPTICAMDLTKCESTRCSSCALCLKFSVHLQVCGRCKQFAYCSRECQKSHWQVHKIQCSSQS
mmetsp:Transcript_16119/g.22259  ORF Transcript_16119/g.22259 Transcript_16119/m.22259 type:complete len:386 (-) Transcript_16119:44-1201(-)